MSNPCPPIARPHVAIFKRKNLLKFLLRRLIPAIDCEEGLHQIRRQDLILNNPLLTNLQQLILNQPTTKEQKFQHIIITTTKSTFQFLL